MDDRGRPTTFTRRTFLHKSFLAGAAASAASYGWFPLLNTIDVAHRAETFKFAYISDTQPLPKEVNTSFGEQAQPAGEGNQAMDPAADLVPLRRAATHL